MKDSNSLASLKKQAEVSQAAIITPLLKVKSKKIDKISADQRLKQLKKIILENSEFVFYSLLLYWPRLV